MLFFFLVNFGMKCVYKTAFQLFLFCLIVFLFLVLKEKDVIALDSDKETRKGSFCPELYDLTDRLIVTK